MHAGDIQALCKAKIKVDAEEILMEGAPSMPHALAGALHQVMTTALQGSCHMHAAVILDLDLEVVYCVLCTGDKVCGGLLIHTLQMQCKPTSTQPLP